MLVKLLRDRDDAVRAAAAFALTWLPDVGGVPRKALAVAASRDRSSRAQASAILSLGYRGTAPDPAVLADRDPVLRTSATIAFAWSLRKKAPRAARAIAAAAIAEPGLATTKLPWNGGDLAGIAAVAFSFVTYARSRTQ